MIVGDDLKLPHSVWLHEMPHTTVWDSFSGVCDQLLALQSGMKASVQTCPHAGACPV